MTLGIVGQCTAFQTITTMMSPVIYAIPAVSPQGV